MSWRTNTAREINGGARTMDILRFVNSKAIREYLKSIDYKFSSLEASWLIYQCESASFAEKKAAWLELIDTMPDCPVPKRMNCFPRNSLHEMIREYIRAVEIVISEFEKEDAHGKYVYRYSYYYEDDPRWSEEFDTVYGSLAACREALKKDVDELDETYSGDGETGLIEYRITKQSLDDAGIFYDLAFKGNGELDSIYNYVGEAWMHDIMILSFEGMWFPIPTPFKKGDILWCPNKPGHMIEDYNCPFVVDGISYESASDFTKKDGDMSDMRAYGFFVNSDGTIYHENTALYMDLEYFDGNYETHEKVLIALGKYLKGEIEIEILLRIYRRLSLKQYMEDPLLEWHYYADLLKEWGIE